LRAGVIEDRHRRAAGDSAHSRLFAYGTLMFPEVRRAVIGDDPATAPVVLAGYGRYTVRHPHLAPFPAIVPHPDQEVAGVLLYDLDGVARDALDQFERIDAGLYRKVELSVRDRAGRALTAVSYVAGPGIASHLHGPWDPEAFRRNQLASFMERVFGRTWL
jgi:gamma-glutamylcyclotransferase (GGCT)/AIG2-like uncharacterized protein YtfP